MLQISNLSKTYKDFSLKNINISLERGYIMGFIGPNGAGKSTTIKLIMNLIKKDSGEIRIFGMENEKNDLAIKERIGFVYDENHFYEELTVLEMKKMISPFYKRWDEDAFQKYMKEFNLPLKKQIKHLSKGMKMKFSLAIALSHHAELFIMDEPTSGLDPLVRSELLEILQMVIQDENNSVFFSTHITSDLDKIADYITLIQNGKIILKETKDQLLDQYFVQSHFRCSLNWVI
ncbi:ABC transporter ATP-binding protein [Bacillaceae bacterium Marseille-Q3522]|nr:ABC transporter ATP-binding protein [Bacillaceae bacterium Marseille-Q3522]